MLKLIIAVNIFLVGAQPVTEKPAALTNFEPGQYVIDDGDEELCGEGEFSLQENGKNLSLGPRHGIDLIPQKESLKGDAPEDKNCIYESENKVHTTDSVNVLTYLEDRVCKGKSKHKLIKVVRLLKEHTVELLVEQAGAPMFSYKCKWITKKLADIRDAQTEDDSDGDDE